MNEKFNQEEFDNFCDNLEEDIDVSDLVKLVFLGDSGVGKTNIMNIFNNMSFNINSKSTIGVDFAIKTVRIRDNYIKLQIWDTAGQERYRTFTAAYFKDSHGLILVYDVTNRQSFKNIHSWLKTAYEHINKEKTSIILIGNKIDLENREVNTIEGEDFAKQNNFLFMETSAFDNRENYIGKAFYLLLKDILKKCDFPDDDQIPKLAKKPEIRDDIVNNPSKINKKGCC
jgi:small GTP-binding protein